MYVLVLRVRVSCISDTFGLGVDSPRITYRSLVETGFTG
jgi:predicted aspartyl protease